MPRNHRTYSSRRANSTRGRRSYGSVGNPKGKLEKLLDTPSTRAIIDETNSQLVMNFDLPAMSIIGVALSKLGISKKEWDRLQSIRITRDEDADYERYKQGNPAYEFSYMKEGKHVVEVLEFPDFEKAKAKAKKLSMKHKAYPVMVSRGAGAKYELAEYHRGTRQNPSMSNALTRNTVSNSNPRRERNVNMAEAIMVGLGSAVGGTVGTTIVEPLISRAKQWLTSRKKNGSYAEAQALSEAFHGRDANEVIEVLNGYHEGSAAGLGKLVELHLLCGNGKQELPITFDYKDPDNVVYVAAPHKRQIIFAGGDQDLDYETIARECGVSPKPNEEALVDLGPVYQIVYFADKHHLEGPKQQKKGMQYFHNFGEESGILPSLFYDVEAEQMLLVGGNYHIEDVGIVD